MLSRVLNWYKSKHPDFLGENRPSEQSLDYLNELCELILLPLEQQFGEVTITYGFTSPELKRYIQKNSPKDTAPELDQHASLELNLKGNQICKRDGASCDFVLKGYEKRMQEVALFITSSLPYDRLYFYGKDKPIHISIGPENSRYALIREANKEGIRVNKQSAKGIDAKSLFESYQKS